MMKEALENGLYNQLDELSSIISSEIESIGCNCDRISNYFSVSNITDTYSGSDYLVEALQFIPNDIMMNIPGLTQQTHAVLQEGFKNKFLQFVRFFAYVNNVDDSIIKGIDSYDKAVQFVYENDKRKESFDDFISEHRVAILENYETLFSIKGILSSQSCKVVMMYNFASPHFQSSLNHHVYEKEYSLHEVQNDEVVSDFKRIIDNVFTPFNPENYITPHFDEWSPEAQSFGKALLQACVAGDYCKSPKEWQEEFSSSQKFLDMMKNIPPYAFRTVGDDICIHKDAAHLYDDIVSITQEYFEVPEHIQEQEKTKSMTP